MSEFAGEGLRQEFVSAVGVVAIIVEEIFAMGGEISGQVQNANEVAVQLGGEFEEFGSNLVEEPALDIIEAAAAPGPIGTPTSFEEGPAAHLVERSELFRRELRLVDDGRLEDVENGNPPPLGDKDTRANIGQIGRDVQRWSDSARPVNLTELCCRCRPVRRCSGEELSQKVVPLWEEATPYGPRPALIRYARRLPAASCSAVSNGVRWSITL